MWRDRCAGCRRSSAQVRAAPMLKADIWARICGSRPDDVLRELCVRDRFAQIRHRELRVDDLLPCPINVMCGHYFEMAPPGRLLADWARYVVEELREANKP